MPKRRDRPDYFSQRAKAERFASRAVYKLADLDRKYRLFAPGYRVLDLGCAPGSWLQYIASRVGPRGLVLGIDRQSVTIPLVPPLKFLQEDITLLDPETLLQETPVFEVVVSDLAPATSGIREVDQARSLELAQLSWQFARRLLAPGGDYVVKVFNGPEVPDFIAELREHFREVKIAKPTGSRPESREIYLVARARLAEPQGAAKSSSRRAVDQGGKAAGQT